MENINNSKKPALLPIPINSKLSQQTLLDNEFNYIFSHHNIFIHNFINYIYNYVISFANLNYTNCSIYLNHFNIINDQIYLSRLISALQVSLPYCKFYYYDIEHVLVIDWVNLI